MSLPAALVSNPVSAVPYSESATPAPPTTTIGQRVVYTALTADVRSLMSGIQTQEQLDDIRERLQNVSTSGELARNERIHDPPVKEDREVGGPGRKGVRVPRAVRKTVALSAAAPPARA
ncbi:hypothetical protein DFH06DRAFT_1348698 [Mycena polygramma]|nr:hypothetical protein DFH06DRAFT_1348698 [Mycena polygramma]